LAIQEIRQTLGRALSRNLYHIFNALNKPFYNSDGHITFSYYDIVQFFKFMNVNSFSFESTKLEPYLLNYVKNCISDITLSQYFELQLAPLPISPNKRASVYRRNSVVSSQTIGAIIPGGEKIYELYLKYYRFEYNFDDFLQILIGLVFTVFHKEIQNESHTLKSVGQTKESSPAKMATVLSNIGNFIERFINQCAAITTKMGGKNHMKIRSGEINEIFIQEIKPLIVIFHYLIGRRVKRVVVDKTNVSHLILISPDECYGLLNDLNAFATPGFILDDFRRVISIVLYQEEYLKYVNEKHEVNSKALISLFDFLEFLYLIAQYMNPNPFIPSDKKLTYLLRYVIYPTMKDKISDLKNAFSSEEYHLISKKKGENLLSIDKILISK